MSPLRQPTKRLTMVTNADSQRDDKGLSTRHLILVFLAGVAVCGVFFSLGFLVGYNERSARLSPITERVSAPATIPPTFNAPLETRTGRARRRGVVQDV